MPTARETAAYPVYLALGMAGFLTRLALKALGWRSLVRLGGLAGGLLYHAQGERRGVIKGEVAPLLGGRLGEDELDRITKRSFEVYYKRMAENIFFGSLDRAVLSEMVKAEGLENLDAALKEGKGVILLLAHFGSFLLPLPFLGHLGYKVNQVAGRQAHGSFLGEAVWRWRKREADKLPVNFIQVERFLRPVYDALKKGEAVAIAFDGREGVNWETVDFLGRRAFFSAGPFTLARRTGAAIIPTFVVRDKDNTHRLVLEPRFELSEGNSAEALHRDTERFAGVFARYVAKFPCHFAGNLYKVKKEQERGGMPLFAEAR